MRFLCISQSLVNATVSSLLERSCTASLKPNETSRDAPKIKGYLIVIIVIVTMNQKKKENDINPSTSQTPA